MEDAVSCFDGFGREHCATQPFKISFQSIEAAKDKLLRETGFDLAAAIDAAGWRFVTTQFQIRHLLAHKLGVIDADYVSKTAAPHLPQRRLHHASGRRHDARAKR